MHVHDSLNLTYALLEEQVRCGAREAMTVGCKPTRPFAKRALNRDRNTGIGKDAHGVKNLVTV